MPLTIQSELWKQVSEEPILYVIPSIIEPSKTGDMQSFREYTQEHFLASGREISYYAVKVKDLSRYLGIDVERHEYLINQTPEAIQAKRKISAISDLGVYHWSDIFRSDDKNYFDKGLPCPIVTSQAFLPSNESREIEAEYLLVAHKP